LSNERPRIAGLDGAVELQPWSWTAGVVLVPDELQPWSKTTGAGAAAGATGAVDAVSWP
jgi:hypothetical protein